MWRFAGVLEIIFYVTNKKLAEYMGKGNSQKKIDKINKYVKMLIYHDLIRILDNDQIPKELLKNALKYTNGNKNRVNFYAIPSWVVQQLKTIEDNGIRWKDKGRTVLGEKKLDGWGNRVTYHERLKPSYYMLQSIWK